MPEYLFINPITNEIISIIQRMTEEHIFEKDGVKYQRIFTIPQSSIGTKIDPFSSKSFVSATENKKDSYDELLKRSSELSEKRKEKLGFDPIEQKKFKEYSEKRGGKTHLREKKQKIKEVLKESKVWEVV